MPECKVILESSGSWPFRSHKLIAKSSSDDQVLCVVSSGGLDSNTTLIDDFRTAVRRIGYTIGDTGESVLRGLPP